MKKKLLTYPKLLLLRQLLYCCIILTLCTTNTHAQSSERKYELVTSINNIEPGKKYIIVGKNSTTFYAMSSQDNNNRKSTLINNSNISGNIIDITAASYSTIEEFTINKYNENNNYYIFLTQNNQYLYSASGSSTSNYLRTQANNDLNGAWEMTIGSNGAVIPTSQGNSVRNKMSFNQTTSPPIFSSYGTAQTPIYLYKKIDTCEAPSQNASNLTISNLSIHSLSLNYTRGNGDNTLIISKPSSAPTPPTSGNPYTLSPTELLLYDGSADGPSTSTTLPATSLQPNTNYHIAIYEYNTTGFCYFPSASTITVLTKPDAPIVANASEIGQSSFVANWNNNTNNGSNALTYEIQVSTENTFGNILFAANTIAATSVNVTNDILPSTTYYYRVRAVNNSGNSDWSSTASLTTDNPQPKINVKNGSTNILSGQNYTGFANVVSGQMGTNETFTIENTGLSTLNITQISITGTHNTQFELSHSVTTINPGLANTFTIRFKPTTVGEKTATVTISNNDFDEGTYTFTITATATTSTSSTLPVKNSYVYPQNINYATYQTTNITGGTEDIEIAQFTIRDGGTTADADNLPTILTQLSISITNAANLRRIALYDGNTELSEVAANANVTFNNLTVSVPDGSSKDISIRVSFKQVVTDNQSIKITITGKTASPSGSQFALFSDGAETFTLGDNNKIEVTATKLMFETHPQSSSLNTNLAPFIVKLVDIFDNIDLDANATITLSPSNGGVNMVANNSYSTTNGKSTINNVLFTSAPQSNITITATATGYNPAVSNPFNIDNFVYQNGDFRTTSNGTWPNNGTATWEKYTATGWVSEKPIASATGMLYIRHEINSNGSIAASGGTKVTIEEGGYFSVGHNSTFALILVKNGGTFDLKSTGVTMSATGNPSKIVEDGGSFIINAGIVNSNNFWRGTENFKENSTVIVSSYSGVFLDATPQINQNSSGALFGNLIFNNNNNITITATSNANVVLCNNLTITNTSTNILVNTAGNSKVTINNSLYVNGGVLRCSTGLNSIIQVNGNIELWDGQINVAPTSNGTQTFNLFLKGNLIANKGTILSSDPDSGIVFIGNTVQTITQSPLGILGTMYFRVKENATVKLNTDLKLGLNSHFIIENNGTFDCSFDDTTPFVITGLGGSIFNAQSGSTIMVTSPDGLAAVPSATGNIQTNNRIFSNDATYIYNGKQNQSTGTGIPNEVKGITTALYSPNLTLSLSNNLTVSQSLSMQNGHINTNDKTFKLGQNNSNPGTLTHNQGYIMGTFARWFKNTPTTTYSEGLFPLGNAALLDRSVVLNLNTAPSLAGYITASIALNTQPDIIPNIVADATQTCDGFSSNTAENIRWEILPEDPTIQITNTALTLSFEDATNTSPLCEITMVQINDSQYITPGTNLTTSGTLNHFQVARAQINSLGSFSIAKKTPCASTTTWNGSWTNGQPTENHKVIISEDYNTAQHGVFSACECQIASNKKLIINENQNITISYGLNAIPNTFDGILVIHNNASLVQLVDVDNATRNNNSGTIEMYRTTAPIHRFDYVYWSSPLTLNSQFLLGRDPNDLSKKGLSPETYFNKYHAYKANQQWEDILHGNRVMTPGHGYSIRAPQTNNYGSNPVLESSYNPFTAKFVGIPNNGIVQVPLHDQGFFTLVGNPYPSAIDPIQFILDPANQDVFDGTIYVWKHATPPSFGLNGFTYTYNDYGSFNLVGGVGLPNDYVIAAAQGFMVKSAQSNQHLTFKNKFRLKSRNSLFYRTNNLDYLNATSQIAPTTQRIWLSLQFNQQKQNQILIGYHPMASNNVDHGFDGALNTTASNYIASSINNKNYSIQGRKGPFDIQDAVQLTLKTATAGNFIISKDHADGSLATIPVFLEDKATGTWHNLSASPYAFYADQGYFEDRFVLRYINQNELDVQEHENPKHAIKLYTQNKVLTITTDNQQLKSVEIFDLQGRRIEQKNNINQNSTQIDLTIHAHQVLLISCTTSDNKTTKHKIVL